MLLLSFDFCCSSRLAFLIMTDLINLMRIFFTPPSCLHGGDLFAHTHLFLKIAVPQKSKNVDERGRNFMCERTLPSLLVQYLSFLVTIHETS